MSITLDHQIRGRYQNVVMRIAEAAGRVGRDPGTVRLVVVTKGQPLEKIRAVIEAGARILGENYAEQAIPKIIALSKYSDLSWHMIGHIQSRKARLVAEHFAWVHSVDRLKLARRLDRHAAELGRRLPVLLEYNVSGESTKFGWPASDPANWASLASDVSAILGLEHLEVRGLMTIGPYVEDPESIRPIFRKLRELRDFLVEKFPAAQWDELSMGMSSDFVVAVEEGATLVRVGQAILGPR